MDYLKLFERAAKMLWQRKILWLFGFLSLFGGCGSNNLGTNFSSNYSNSSSGSLSRSSTDFVGRLVTDYLPLLIVGAILLFLLGIALFILGYIARAGLIDMTAGYESGSAPTVGEGFGKGSHYWLKLLGIDLVLFAPVTIALLIVIGVIVAVIVVSAPGAASVFGTSGSEGSGALAGSVFGGICGLLVLIGILVIVMIPVMIFLGVLQVLAHRACVVGGEGVFSSIGSGYRLIRTRFGDVALVWLLRAVIGIPIGVVMLLPGLLFIGIPLAVMLFNVIVGAILMIPGGLAMLFLLGVVEAFTSIVWTLAYREIAAPTPAAASEGAPAPAPAT